MQLNGDGMCIYLIICIFTIYPKSIVRFFEGIPAPWSIWRCSFRKRTVCCFFVDGHQSHDGNREVMGIEYKSIQSRA